MKYETPELTLLVPAISVIQSTSGATKGAYFLDKSSGDENDVPGGYADWE